MDDVYPVFRCTEIRRRGPAAVERAAYHLPCAINAAMVRAEAALRQSLAAQTAADLLTVLRDTLDARQVERAAVWLRDYLRRYQRLTDL